MKFTSQDAMANNSIYELWTFFAQSQTLLKKKLGRSANILGEIAELIVAKTYNGELLPASTESADVVLRDGRKIQVKARIPRQTANTKLGVIRSWDFDLLAVLIFDENGCLTFAGEMNVDDARGYAADDKHQKGWAISTKQDFLGSSKMRDVTTMYAKTLRAL